MTSVTSEAPRLGADGRGLLFTDAHTVKRFSSEPVGDDRPAGIWNLAKWPPTLWNFQPLRVLFVRSPEGFERLMPHLTERNRGQSASAPVSVVLALDREYHEHAQPVTPHAPQPKGHLAKDDQRRDGLGRFSAALQAGYFILAVRAVGLHAGPRFRLPSKDDRNWHDHSMTDANCTTGKRYSLSFPVNVLSSADQGAGTAAP